MTGVTVREYRPSDLEACRDLWRELTQHHRDIYDDQTIGGDDPRRFFDAHLASVGAKNVFVAEVRGEVVGMAGLEPKEGDWQVEPVVVTRACRGKGVGKALVAKAIEEARARGVKLLCVGPVARNASAIRFFKSTGFCKLGEVHLYADIGDEKGTFGKGAIRLGDEEFEY